VPGSAALAAAAGKMNGGLHALRACIREECTTSYFRSQTIIPHILRKHLLFTKVPEFSE
jgi:hypothetical protein